MRKLDILQDLLEEPGITEIMINGYQDIFIEKEGELIRVDKHFISEEKLSDVIQQIVAQNNRVVNESHPIVDTRLEDGSRVNIVLPPIAIDQSVICIRRFSKNQIRMKDLVEKKSLSEEMRRFLEQLVCSGYNLFISGSTGSGKTTLINALSEYIPKSQRVITIEDSAELQLIGVENLVRLEAREKNLEGKLEITIRDLVRSSLRMRPDRIIVGECRGAETIELLMANNTGHSGGMSTGHANSTRDMISRLEMMSLMGMDLPMGAIRKQIASGIDIFIHIQRMPDRTRKIVEIAEVMGVVDDEVQLETKYRYMGDDIWVQEHPLVHTDRLEQYS
jgi:pilus assembly protein CpaF